MTLLPLVSAQYFYNQGFGSFPSLGIDFSLPGILNFYNSNYEWIDILLIFGLLLGLTKKLLEDTLGKPTPIFLSLILAIGFGLMERKFDFNLGYFGPIVLLILFLIISQLIFKKFETHKKASIIGSIITAVILASLFGPALGSRIFDFQGADILSYVIIFGLIGLIVWFFWSRAPTELREGEFGPTRVTYNAALKVDSNAKGDYKKLQKLINYFLALPNQEPFDKLHFEERYKSARASIDEFLTKYRGTKYTDEVLKQLSQIEVLYEKYKEEVEQPRLKAAYESNKLQEEKKELEKVNKETGLSEDEDFEKLRESFVIFSDFLKNYELHKIDKEELEKEYSPLKVLFSKFISKYPSSQYIKGIKKVLSNIETKIKETDDEEKNILKEDSEKEEPIEGITSEELQEAKNLISRLISELEFIIKNFDKLWESEIERINSTLKIAAKTYNELNTADVDKSLIPYLKKIISLGNKINEEIIKRKTKDEATEDTKKLQANKTLLDELTKYDNFLASFLKKLETEPLSKEETAFFTEIAGAYAGFLNEPDLSYELKSALSSVGVKLAKLNSKLKEPPKNTLEEEQKEINKTIQELRDTIANFESLWRKDKKNVLDIILKSSNLYDKLSESPDKPLLNELETLGKLDQELFGLRIKKASESENRELEKELDNMIQKLNDTIDNFNELWRRDKKKVEELYSLAYNLNDKVKALPNKTKTVINLLNELDDLKGTLFNLINK